jgi:flagellar biosynthesis/type III secretory pathway ATPase
MGFPAIPQGHSMSRLFMAFVDYEKVHSALVRRCASEYPGTETALQAAIAEWTKTNQSALDDIRVLVRDQMIQQGMSKDEADVRAAQSAEKITAFMINGIAKDPNLDSACRAGYAEQLASPEMNYTSFLERLRRERKK